MEEEAAVSAAEEAETGAAARGGGKEGRKGLVVHGWFRMSSSLILWVGMIWRHWLMRSWHSAKKVQ